MTAYCAECKTLITNQFDVHAEHSTHQTLCGDCWNKYLQRAEKNNDVGWFRQHGYTPESHPHFFNREAQ